MRWVEQHKDVRILGLTEHQLNRLSSWLTIEIEDAFAARAPLDEEWRNALRLYEGIPKNPVKNIPVENAPNTEVTLAAISADSIYAQSQDLIFNITPIVTVRPTGKAYVPNAKALQRFVNWGVDNEFILRPATEHSILDDVQLGTGVYYTPWVESVKKTSINKIRERGPRIYSVPSEDFLVPGGSYDNHQRLKWNAMRTWMTRSELNTRSALRNWDVKRVLPAGHVDWVRSKRETLGHTITSGRRISDLFEIMDIYCYFDIDEDGMEEDLLVIWDRTSKKVLKVGYNPYDHRPFDVMRYQLRSHLFYGLGVIEMLKQFQEEVTDLHNYRTLNVLLANCRIWKAKDGSVPDDMKLWPNRVIMMANPDDLKPEQMGDVYPSSFQAEAATISLAERRVGINEMSMPRPSQVLGSRTPGITTMTLMQQVSRRFTPAFDAMRIGTSGAVRQCLYRYQERLLMGDKKAEEHLRKLLGEPDAQLVIEVLKADDFDEAVAVELTASSASINRDADKQNAMLLVNILGQYYQRMIELTAMATNPQTPPEVQAVAKKVAIAASEIIDRTVRTFEMMRDPQDFIIKIEGELDGAMGGMPQQGLAGLSQLLAQFSQGQEAIPAGGAGG